MRSPSESAAPTPTTISLERSTSLAAPAPVVWRHATTPAGINAEFRPWIQLDAGLFFIAFQRDPRRQFVPIQQQLGRQDALNEYIRHTGSGIFACPPGTRPGGYVGETLFR